MLIVVAVAALHAVVVWVLLERLGLLRLPALPPSLELLRLPSPPRHPEPLTSSAALPQLVPTIPRLAEPPPVVPPALAAPAPDDDAAIHPPIDWAGELSRQAHDSIASEADRHYRAFEFPHPPPALTKEPEFAWSRTHAHRIEVYPGSMLVHLSDNCVLMLFPLPFVGCGLGHKAANADLFRGAKGWTGATDRDAP